MPIYEYTCPECKFEFEQKLRYEDSRDVKCPKCKKKARIKISPSLVIYKGSGFYCTDHGKG
jgi:putative FmdB family regulatory protein